MKKKTMAAHLIDRGGVLRCSVCQQPFPPNSQPSMSKAFADHVRKAHKPEQKPEDASQKAV